MPVPDERRCPPSELNARLQLHSLPEIGPRRLRTLLTAFGNATAALCAPACEWRSLGIPAACANARGSSVPLAESVSARAWLERPDQHLLMWDSPAYPSLLAQIPDPPPLLFVAGNPELLEKPQLAIVGSRRASRPALDTATAFAARLAQVGFTITSGLAQGIDAASHEAALQVNGSTVAVVGTGLQKCYPQKHKALARAIVNQGGALVSEFPLSTAPQPANFPRRNRIISGLSLGVLVVEASLASGSLITARLAAEQGREVFAIPGSIHFPGVRGCHQLIRDGALLVEEVEQIMEALQGWQQLPMNLCEPVATPSTCDSPVWRALLAAPQTAEALAIASGQSLAHVLAGLTELELDGRVSNESGRWFARPG